MRSKDSWEKRNGSCFSAVQLYFLTSFPVFQVYYYCMLCHLCKYLTAFQLPLLYSGCIFTTQCPFFCFDALSVVQMLLPQCKVPYMGLIQEYRLTSNLTVAYHIISYCIVSYYVYSIILIVSYLSYCLLLYRIVSYHNVSSRIESYHIVSYCILSNPILSYCIVLYSFISYPFVLYCIVSWLSSVLIHTSETSQK